MNFAVNDLKRIRVSGQPLSSAKQLPLNAGFPFAPLPRAFAFPFAVPRDQLKKVSQRSLSKLHSLSTEYIESRERRVDVKPKKKRFGNYIFWL